MRLRRAVLLAAAAFALLYAGMVSQAQASPLMRERALAYIGPGHHARVFDCRRRRCDVVLVTRDSFTDNGVPIKSTFTGWVYERRHRGRWQCTFGPDAWPWEYCSAKRVLVGRLDGGFVHVHRKLKPPVALAAVGTYYDAVFVNSAGANDEYIGKSEIETQNQINGLVSPAYGTPGVQFVANGPASMIVVLGTASQVEQWCYDPNAGGCHTFQNGFIWLFVARSAVWSVTLSHELIESDVDPTTANAAFGLLVEPCDPVAPDGYWVDRGQVLLSDFVWPSWFNPAGGAPYDYMGYLHAPRTLVPGGYDYPVG